MSWNKSVQNHQNINGLHIHFCTSGYDESPKPLLLFTQLINDKKNFNLQGGNVGDGIPGAPAGITIFVGLMFAGFVAFVFALANSILIVVGDSGSNRTP